MSFFGNLLAKVMDGEILAKVMETVAPLPAPRTVVKATQIDVGSEIATESVDGELFPCHAVVSAHNNDSNLVRKNYILGVTDSQIVELTPILAKPGYAIVKEVHELQGLSKLRFKKSDNSGGSSGVLVLEFASGKASKLVMKDPASCVEVIKGKMKQVGIKGNVTKTTKLERDIANATSCFARAKEIEQQFSLAPTLTLIQEMMDLCRRATEKFGEANDENYTEVIVYIKKFLQRADVTSLLDTLNEESHPFDLIDKNLSSLDHILASQPSLSTPSKEFSHPHDHHLTPSSSSSSGNHKTDAKSEVCNLLTKPGTPMDKIHEAEDEELKKLKESLSFLSEDPDDFTTRIRAKSEHDDDLDDSHVLSLMLNDITDEFDLLMGSFDEASNALKDLELDAGVVEHDAHLDDLHKALRSNSYEVDDI